MNQPCILVVASDNDERRAISAWLDDAGYDDVMFCPGPGGPDYTCLGGRGAMCPLTAAADIVVVDMKLRSDEMMQGTPGWQLLLYYYEHGKNIVAISGPEDAVHPFAERTVRVVDRPPHHAQLLDAIRSFEPVAVRA